jgi:hypothetical protein
MEPILYVAGGIAAATAVIAAAAQQLNWPSPVLLVLAGLVVALVPGLPRVELDPDLVLLVLSGLPAMMGHNEYLNMLLSDRLDDDLQVLDQTDLLRDLLHPWPQFAAFGQEIVIRIDE